MLSTFGKYTIEKKLGQGGMGAVYLAFDSSLNRKVALKVITSDDKDMLERFHLEAQAVAKLKHPNIVQVHETGVIAKQHYFTMDYIEGASLEKLIVSKTKLNFQNISKIIMQVASALHYAHKQQIIHRDVKPANILIDKSGKVYLTDFGLAKQLTGLKKSLTISGTTLGTPYYMPPEQAMGKKQEIDPRSDVYALGATLYHCLTGQVPFTADEIYDVLNKVINEDPPRPSAIVHHIPKDLETICLKCLEKEKDKRYQTTQELADDMARYLKNEPIKARPVSTVYKITRIIKRNKVIFSGASVGVVLVLVLIGVLITSGRRSAEQRQTAQGFLAQANKSYEAKDWLKAKEFYNKYLTLIKTDKSVETKLIEIEKNMTDKEKAEKQAQDEAQNAYLYAANIFPEFFKLKTDMDKVWQQIDKAIGMLDESLKKKPNPFGYFYRGMLFREKGELERAEQDFTKAIEQDKDFKMGWIMRGTVYFEQYLNLLSTASAGETGEQQEVSAELTEKARADFDRAQEIKADKYAQITEQFKKFIPLFEAVIWRGKDNQRCVKLLEEGYKEYKTEDFLYWLGATYSEQIKDYEQAEKHLREALELRPQYSQAFFTLGNIKRYQKDWDGSITLYDSAIKINPNLAAAYNNRGTVKLDKGDWDGALADYNTVIKLNQNLALAYNNRGTAKLNKGDWDGALADFNTAIKLNPNLAAAYYNRGNEKYKKGDLDGAIADYNTAMKLNPNKALVYSSRGNAKKDKGDLDGAMADYNTAIKIDPNYAEAYGNRGNAKKDKGNLDGAIADYDTVIRLNPNDAVSYYNRGAAKEKKGNLDGAIADYDTAIKLNPNYVLAYTGRGLAKYKKGDLDGAIADLNTAIKLNPNDAMAYTSRGVAKSAKGDLDGAITDYNTAIKLDPNSFLAYTNRGGLKCNKGDLDGAIADLNTAIKLNPNNALAYTNRGIAKNNKGNLDGAITDWNTAIKLDPNLAQAYALRGIAKNNKGELKGALEDLETAVRLNPAYKDGLAPVIEEIKKKLPR